MFAVPLFFAMVLGCGDPPLPPGGSFAITTQPSVLVPFSDGTTTRADVRFPSALPGDCGWPVIVLVHGMGGSRVLMAGLATSLAERGYLTIAYDVRGHGQHLGNNTHTSLRERIDLGEVIGWATSAFPGIADGERVGVDGASMGGMHAWMAAAWDGAPYEANGWTSGSFPDIDAVVCENTTPDFAANYAPQALAVHCSDFSFVTQSGVRYDPALRTLALAAFTNEAYFVWHHLVAGPLSDPNPRLATITCPVMAMMAWDDFQFPSNALTEAWDQIPATTPKKLYMGTGGHNSPNNAAEAAFRTSWRVEWFDRWLKSEQNGIDAGSEITYAVTPDDTSAYLSPSSQWTRKSTDAWPPAGALASRWYVRANGELTRTPPESSEPKEQLVQTVAPGFGMTEQANAGFQLGQVEANIPRATVAYESAPLSHDLEYAGDARVRLSVESVQRRWQVRARLIDVDASGASRYVAAGSFFAFDDAPAGERTIEVAIGANAYIFRAGHRLRLELENLQIHDPPQGAGLRFAAYPHPFTLSIEHSPARLSWLELPAAVEPTPIVYGTAKVNSFGCVPAIGWRGTASVSSANSFTINATNVISHKSGMLLYSFGPAATPFQGGTLYVATPIRRTPNQFSGGNSAPFDCSGKYEFAFNALIQSGADPNLSAGVTVFAQYLTRDPQSLGAVGLTEALTFVIAP